MSRSNVLILLTTTVLTGCASTAALLMQDQEWAASEPVLQAAEPVVNGAIYQAGQEIRLFENAVSRRVGDVLTIRLVEVTSAQKSSSTSSSKNSNIDIPAPTIIGRDVPIGSRIWGDTSIGGGTTFGGAGASAQSNSLVGDITVTVAKRWPNGNLFVRGEKWITINQGREFVRVSGIVRAADINPDNTVLSTRVADARITYSSRGVLADANKPGLLSRFFNLPWMPL
jgi:flagellar L-ring protein precursor FlgH